MKNIHAMESLENRMLLAPVTCAPDDAACLTNNITIDTEAVNQTADAVQTQVGIISTNIEKLGNLQDDHRNVVLEVNIYQTTLGQAQSDNSALTGTIEADRSALSCTESQTQSNLQMLGQLAADTKAELETVNNYLKAAQDKNSALEKDIQEIQDDITDQSNHKTQLKNDIETARLRTLELEAEKSQLNEQLENAKKSNQESLEALNKAMKARGNSNARVNKVLAGLKFV